MAKKKTQKKTGAQKSSQKKLTKKERLSILTAFFKKYGARNPESWASSQVEEGINQAHRFLFLRQAWRSIIDDQDPSWIEAHRIQAKKFPTAPYSGIGQGLERILEKGVDPQDIIDVVRGMQADFLYRFCLEIEDPFADEEELESLNVRWALAEVIEDPETFEIKFTGNTIQALHESVLDTDPTGREMRPRPLKKSST